MIPIFMDTSAFIALYNKQDSLHPQAVALHKQLTHTEERTLFVTTSAVILELSNAFSRTRFRNTFHNINLLIKNSSIWEYIHVDEDLMNQGIQRFHTYDDKDWSVVDCIGMIVAENAGIQDIFTSDHGFKQAGFNILLTTAKK